MPTTAKPSDVTDLVFGALDPSTAAALLAAAGDIALVIDSHGVIRDVAVSEHDTSADFSAAEWVGRSWTDTVSADTRMKVESLLKEAATSGVSKRRQVNHTALGGNDIPVVYTAIRLGPDGGLVAVGRDMRHLSMLQKRLVEAQQAMERDYWKLRHVETRYRLLFQLASDGILVLDASTLKVVDANAAAGQMFSEPAERLVGRVFPFGVPATSTRAIADLFAAAPSAGRAGGINGTQAPNHRH